MSTPSNPVQFYAAGSLRDVLTEIVRQYEALRGKGVLTTGASGLLADRIAKGEAATVFASAVLAKRMARFIVSPAARVVFERYGFDGP